MNSESKLPEISGNSPIYILSLASGALLLGLLISLLIIRPMLPGMVQSIIGDEKFIFWFLSRSTAVIAYLTLWISILLGVLLSTKLSKFFPGAFTANDLHLFLSLLGLTLGVFHGVIILGDRFIQAKLINILIPFTFIEYRPFWVGFGQMALILWSVLVISYYLKKRIGYKTWRLIHYLGFLAYVVILIHGVFSGSDTNTIWATSIYWITGGSTLFLSIYRILSRDPRKISSAPSSSIDQKKVAAES